MSERSSDFDTWGTSSRRHPPRREGCGRRRWLAVRIMGLLSLQLGIVGCVAVGSTLPRGGIDLLRGIEFDGPDGADLLKLDPRRSGVTLRDGAGNTRARYRMEDGRIRIQDSLGGTSSFVSRREGGGGFQISTKPGGPILYELLWEPDGDLRLVDGEATMLYEIKVRDYGLKVVDGGGKLEGKVRMKRGKISLRDSEGKTVLGTRDPIPPLAVACLALRDVDLNQRVGLALAVIHWSGP